MTINICTVAKKERKEKEKRKKEKEKCSYIQKT